MSLWKLVLRNLTDRTLSSVLTAMSVALGVMLVTAILLLQAEMERAFLRPGQGYSLVVGAPGSSLQLVLNAIYHLEQSPGLLPMSVFEELETHDSVALAVPYAVGDAFRGYRVVGSTDAFFHPKFPHPAGDAPEQKLAEGRPFRYSDEGLEDALREVRVRAGLEEGDVHHGEDVHHDEDEHHGEDGSPPEDEHHDEPRDHEEHDAHQGGHEEHEGHNEYPFEAVVGWRVANALGIRLGDKIEPTHGIDSDSETHDHVHLWEVVGILKKTDTPVDEIVVINLDSFYRIPDHTGAIIPNTTEPGLSAVVVFPRPGVHKAMLLGRLRRRPDLQVANVSDELDRLFTIVGSVDVLFLIVSLMVVAIGILSIMVAIYNTMAGRRREIAILRALGARQRTVLFAIMGEATILTAAGAFAGVLLGHGLVFGAASTIADIGGFEPNALQLLPVEFAVLGAVTLVGSLAGLLPAASAYRTDVAANLAPRS